MGPTRDGEFVDGIYANMAIVRDWMKKNARAVKGTQPLPAPEQASVPATAQGKTRYLFALPAFKEGGMFEKDLLPAEDTTLTLKTASKPRAVRLLAGARLEHSFADGTVTIKLPAAQRTPLVDVVEVTL